MAAAVYVVTRSGKSVYLKCLSLFSFSSRLTRIWTMLRRIGNPSFPSTKNLGSTCLSPDSLHHPCNRQLHELEQTRRSSSKPIPTQPSFVPTDKPLAHPPTITVRKPSTMTRRAADDLLAELDSLGSEEQAAPTTKPASKPAPKQATAKNEEEENPFGDLEKTLAAKPASTSRPTTPRVSSSTTSGKAVTPASSSNPASERTSEEKLRAESVKGEGGVTPTEQQQTKESTAAASGGGGGWWGSMFSAATAAVKQAENLAKEIRGNEEAIKWAEQVKNYGAGLQSLSTSSTYTTPSLKLPRFLC